MPVQAAKAKARANQRAAPKSKAKAAKLAKKPASASPKVTKAKRVLLLSKSGSKPGGPKGRKVAERASSKGRAKAKGRGGGKEKERSKEKKNSSNNSNSNKSNAASAGGRSGAKRRSDRGEDEDEEEEEDELTDDGDSDDEAERKMWEEEWRKIRNEEAIEAALEQNGAAAQAPHRTSTAPAVPYQIAIPTHGRWKPVGEMTGKVCFRGMKQPFILAHTLDFLERQGIKKELVTLFVATESERENYRTALKSSAWSEVKIVLSALGNKNNRNFIYTYYPAGSYVVSIDDDVERICWKITEGITHTSLVPMPDGGFERVIFDAYARMKESGAHLWGLNTSQNPRHMKCHGVSVRNGLVNGYLNGFICRPEATELLRTFADATEDSEFAVRHYAKDGVVLRYRMYAGITSPYLNCGGLQEKFAAAGEKITASERSDARKQEERWGATELHKLFPRLIGPPQPRRDKKTMEVVFYSNGYPPGEGALRRMISPRLRDDDKILYAENPKKPGSKSFELYEKYQVAKSFEEARKLGARGIDFAFDTNWGYLQVTDLSFVPASTECTLDDAENNIPQERFPPLIATSGTKSVRVRVKEMSLGHQGIAISTEALSKLAERTPQLAALEPATWAKAESPLATVPLAVVRVLLHWGHTGRLAYARKETKALHRALKSIGANEAARAVRLLEAKEFRRLLAEAKAKAKASGRAVQELEVKQQLTRTFGKSQAAKHLRKKQAGSLVGKTRAAAGKLGAAARKAGAAGQGGRGGRKPAGGSAAAAATAAKKQPARKTQLAKAKLKQKRPHKRAS